MPTPWAALRTVESEGFTCSGRRNELRIATRRMDGDYACRLDLTSSAIYLDAPRRGTVNVKPYRLTLPPWTSLDPPVVRAHPFVLLHLAATGQADVDEVIAHITRMGRDTVRVTLPLTKRCGLLTMLRVPRAGLTLATRYDLTTARDDRLI